MSRPTWILASLLLVPLTVSCGGDDAKGGSCPSFTACGGDPTGLWNVSKMCNADEAFGSDLNKDEFCATATVDTSGISLGGTVELKADKSYATNITTSGSIKIVLPSSCLTQGSQSVTCAQLNQLFAAQGSQSDDLSSGSCAASGSSCVCTFTMKPSTSKETGTWSTAGNVLTTKTGSDAPETADYCVKGNEFHVASTTSVNMGTMGTMKATAYMVLKR